MTNRFDQLPLIDSRSATLEQNEDIRWDPSTLTRSSPQLAYLLGFPQLSTPFSCAISAICQGYGSRATATLKISHLKDGFCRFLSETRQESISLELIDSVLINQFVTFLTESPCPVATKRNRLHTVKSIFEWLKSSEWKLRIRSDLRFPKNAWPGAERHIRPRPSAHRDELLSIYKAAVNDCIETIRRVEPVLNYLDCVDPRPEDSELLRVIERLNSDIPSVLKGRLCLLKKGLLTDKESKKHGGILKLKTYLLPTPSFLVPFAVVMAIHTRYNPDVILGSKLSDFSVEEVLGHKMFRAASYKMRSRRKQIVYIPVDESPDNPKVLFDFLVRWTSRIRPHSPDIDRDCLFIFLTEAGGNHVHSFWNETTGTRSASTAWQHNYRAFCNRHGVASANLSSLRKAVLDLAHELSGGDLRMVQAIANHRSAQTTNDHYKSASAGERQMERLAQIMAARSRWIDSEGKIDVRGTPKGGDIGASTPGWNCLDPYASPFWSKDSLCSAYGYCPICPLATLDTQSAYCCAQAHNLLDAIRRSQQTISPDAWLTRMAPIQSALINRWLPRFNENVTSAAMQMAIPPLPTLE